MTDTDQALSLWPRIERAIYASTVSRSAIDQEWPECHRKNCHGHHGSPDEAFRLFTERVAASVLAELSSGHREWWKAVLDPFEDLYTDMMLTAKRRITEADDDELDKIAAALAHLSQTNCSSAMFEIGELINPLVARECDSRAKADA